MTPPANRPRTPSNPVVQPRTAPPPTPSAHSQSHSPSPPPPRRPSTSSKVSDPSKPKREVTLVACVDCRSAGRRCGSERPCQRCIERGWQDRCKDSRQVPGRPNFGRGPPESPPVARRRTTSDAPPPTTPPRAPTTRRTSINSILAHPLTPSTTPPRRRTQSYSQPRPRRLSLSSDVPPLPPVPKRKDSLTGYNHVLLHDSTLHFAPRPPQPREQRSTEVPESFARYSPREVEAIKILAELGASSYGGRASPVARSLPPSTTTRTPRRDEHRPRPTCPSTPTFNAYPTPSPSYPSFPPYLFTPSAPSPSYRPPQLSPSHFPATHSSAPAHPEYSPERLHALAYSPRSSLHPDVLATLSLRSDSRSRPTDSPRGRPLSYMSTGSGRSDSPARARPTVAVPRSRTEYYPSWSASVVQAQAHAQRGYRGASTAR